MSRWNTLWSRILRLYASVAQPTFELKRIVNGIVKFSAPMWFHIKCNPLVIHGPHNTFQSFKFLKHLSADEKKIAKKAIQRNAFFAHPDQLLLAMCADIDESVRHKAVKMLRNLRENKKNDDEKYQCEDSDDDGFVVDEDLLTLTDDESMSDENESFTEDTVSCDKSIRKVHVPDLKFQAHTYHSMIDWQKELRTEPPFISRLSDTELLGILETPLCVPKWPNSTQAVERGIKLVAEACSAVVGQSERDGYIRQRLHSRKVMPKFHTKRNYNANL